MQQKQWDHQRSLHAAASFMASQSPSEFITDFRSEYDASVEKDELQIAFQSEERMECKRSLYIQEARKELRRGENSNSRLVHFFEWQMRNQPLEYSSQSSAYESIDYERQNIEKTRIIFVPWITEKKFSVHFEKQLDEASQQSQVVYRKKIVKQSLNRSESQAMRLPQHILGISGSLKRIHMKPRNFNTQKLLLVRCQDDLWCCQSQSRLWSELIVPAATLPILQAAILLDRLLSIPQCTSKKSNHILEASTNSFSQVLVSTPQRNPLCFSDSNTSTCSFSSVSKHLHDQGIHP